MSSPYAQDRAFGHKATTHFFLELLRQYFHFSDFESFFGEVYFAVGAKLKQIVQYILQSQRFSHQPGETFHMQNIHHVFKLYLPPPLPQKI